MRRRVGDGRGEGAAVGVGVVVQEPGGGNREGCVLGHGVVVVVRHRGIVDGRDLDGHGGQLAEQRAVGGPVGEGVGAREVVVGPVGEVAVGVDDDDAVEAGKEVSLAEVDRDRVAGVDVVVADEQVLNGDGQHGVLLRGVAVVVGNGGCRGRARHPGDRRRRGQVLPVGIPLEGRRPEGDERRSTGSAAGAVVGTVVGAAAATAAHVVAGTAATTARARGGDHRPRVAGAARATSRRRCVPAHRRRRPGRLGLRRRGTPRRHSSRGLPARRPGPTGGRNRTHRPSHPRGSRWWKGSSPHSRPCCPARPG